MNLGHHSGDTNQGAPGTRQATKEEHLSTASKNERRFVFGELGTSQVERTATAKTQRCSNLDVWLRKAPGKQES